MKSYEAFIDLEATLIEINPLIWTEDDRVVALDAKVSIDNNALFYMTSRGVPPTQARALLTRAFLSDALEGLDEATTEALDAEITALLETAA